jgi:hypothetical protein
MTPLNRSLLYCLLRVTHRSDSRFQNQHQLCYRRSYCTNFHLLWSLRSEVFSGCLNRLTRYMTRHDSASSIKQTASKPGPRTISFHLCLKFKNLTGTSREGAWAGKQPPLNICTVIAGSATSPKAERTSKFPTLWRKELIRRSLRSAHQLLQVRE